MHLLTNIPSQWFQISEIIFHCFWQVHKIIEVNRIVFFRSYMYCENHWFTYRGDILLIDSFLNLVMEAQKMLHGKWHHVKVILIWGLLIWQHQNYCTSLFGINIPKFLPQFRGWPQTFDVRCEVCFEIANVGTSKQE